MHGQNHSKSLRTNVNGKHTDVARYRFGERVRRSFALDVGHDADEALVSLCLRSHLVFDATAAGTAQGGAHPRGTHVLIARAPSR